ncbi:uncharacterized protein BXZ73DRAFT_111370 [Epithele typhae]|uniref:uncharacterized protein n=1 Tax=Epithele typhae TaxID=378194 RepID=UPI002008A2C4|nr:uncharacterized protein BXZ73DRAFT_111370 [Epithele typhae]KAH9903885.1 hypothetical protein BXZ73DRAFT_111370 [Epithele typhae]
MAITDMYSPTPIAHSQFTMEQVKRRPDIWHTAKPGSAAVMATVVGMCGASSLVALELEYQAGKDERHSWAPIVHQPDNCVIHIIDHVLDTDTDPRSASAEEASASSSASVAATADETPTGPIGFSATGSLASATSTGTSSARVCPMRPNALPVSSK